MVMQMQRCARCGGWVYETRDDTGELSCIRCGYLSYATPPISLDEAKEEMKVRVVGHLGGKGRD